MTLKWNREHHYGILAAAAATVSTVITVLLATGITALFQSRGAPLEQLAAAERACAQEAYVSDRLACMTTWIAAGHESRIAER